MELQYLDFERPVRDVVSRIQQLQSAQAAGEAIPEKDIPGEIHRLQLKQAQLLRRVYRDLDPWQKLQIARHPQRPLPRDYIHELITDWVPLSGDRLSEDDAALIAGMGRFDGKPVAVLGIDKGRTTNERVKQNFGMPKPSGYRKAQRVMQLADRFKMPVMCFIDTPGAYPGVDAEAKGQAEAIARSIEQLLNIDVPILSVITGEGGSGGALALGVADKVMLLEHSVYSVISPEGCASILWKVADKQTIPQAAQALKLTAQDLLQHKLIDIVIKEPVGGAQRDKDLTLKRVKTALEGQLEELAKTEISKHTRREKYLRLTA